GTPRVRPSAISRRPSSWLEDQGQRPAMQRAGTLRYMGPPRPGPLLNRPRGDKCSEQGRPSQANRGPKKQPTCQDVRNIDLSDCDNGSIAAADRTRELGRVG